MNYGYPLLNYGYPKINSWISKNHDELWISIRFLDIQNRIMDILKSVYLRISLNVFYDIQK